MRWLDNLYYCLQISPRFFRLYLGRSNLLSNNVQKLLTHEHVDLDNLPASLKKRVPLYLFSNALTAQWFSTMRGFPLTRDEKTNCQLMAIATPLFDQLSDHLEASYDEIKIFLQEPGSNELLQTCSKVHKLIEKRTTQLSLFQKYFTRTMAAQERSLQQKADCVSEDVLRQITNEKGGNALLLYRTGLNHRLLPREDELIFRLGGLMQLYNDMFDIYRDHVDGIKTLATECTQISSLRSYFQSQIDDMHQCLFSLPYHKRNLKMANILISLTLNSGFVCLDQLESLEDHSGKFQVALYERKDLICDMEKASNIIHTLSRTIWHV